MINKVILVGRVGNVKVNNYNGGKVVNMSIATTKRYKGENQTVWNNCTGFGKTADLIEQYVQKGHILGVEGELETSEYQGNDNQKRYKTFVLIQKINFFPSQKQNNNQNGSFNQQQSPPQNQFISDDIPF